MGCTPLDKPTKKRKKGLWSPDEDQKLRNYVLKHGHGCWTSVPINAGLQRNGKSSRLRWINYLRPGLKRGPFSIAEEELVLTLHRILGNKWSQIAHNLPGRTDNEIKNYWHSYLKKRAAKMGEIKARATKDEHTNVQTQGKLQQSTSSFKSAPQNSSIESFEHVEGSIVDNDGSKRQTEAQKQGHLPKVFFAEWLTFDDQLYGQESSHNSSCSDFKNHVGNSSSNLEYTLMVSDGTWGSETNTDKEVYVDDMFHSPVKFQVSESGDLVDYFPGEFFMNCDDLYNI